MVTFTSHNLFFKNKNVTLKDDNAEQNKLTNTIN